MRKLLLAHSIYPQGMVLDTARVNNCGITVINAASLYCVLPSMAAATVACGSADTIGANPYFYTL